MKLLALSGSARRASTNTSLLKHLAELAPPDIEITLFEDLIRFPVFSPDLEGEHTPAIIETFCKQVRHSDGIVISSPEYVRAIPGGLKNAVDWLVSRDEIVEKPIALLHASHRGDDCLRELRVVLRTVSQKFNEDNFVRFPLMSKSPDEIRDLLLKPENASQLKAFLASFKSFVAESSGLTSRSKFGPF